LKPYGNVAILPNLHAVKQNRVKIDKTYWRSGIQETVVISPVRGSMFGFVIFRIIFCVINLKSIIKQSIWMKVVCAEQDTMILD